MIYETDNNRENEIEILTEFCRRLDHTFELQPKMHFYDADIFDDSGRTAIAEVKNRHFNLIDGVCYPKRGNQFWKIPLSRHKVDQILELSNREGIVPIFIIRTFNGIFWIKLSEDYQINVAGRTNQTRRDKDIEECYMIPANEFKQI